MYGDYPVRVFSGRKHFAMIQQLQLPGDEVFASIVEFVRQHCWAGILGRLGLL
jgi:hypothetical protein